MFYIDEFRWFFYIIKREFFSMNWVLRTSSGVPGVFISGAVAQGVYESPPVGSRSEAPVGTLGHFIPQVLKQFADIVYIFWLHETTKMWKFRTIHLLILDQYVSQWKAKRHLGA